MTEDLARELIQTINVFRLEVTHILSMRPVLTSLCAQLETLTHEVQRMSSSEDTVASEIATLRQEIADNAAAVQAYTAAVAANTKTQNDTLAAVNQKLADLLAGGADPTAVAELKQMAADLQTNNTAINTATAQFAPPDPVPQPDPSAPTA